MLSYQVRLFDVVHIGSLTLKRRRGTPVTRENLPRYVVFDDNGRCLDEFRHKTDALRFCKRHGVQPRLTTAQEQPL